MTFSSKNTENCCLETAIYAKAPFATERENSCILAYINALRSILLISRYFSRMLTYSRAHTGVFNYLTIN